VTGAKTAVPLWFEPGLAEEAVFQVLHAGQVDGRLAARIRRRRSRIYNLPQGDERDTAFVTASLEAFRGLALERVFQETLDELPKLSALAELKVMKARSRPDEHAELLVREEGGNGGGVPLRRGVVWVLVSRFLEPETTRHFLRRELFHLSDMLDERFAYRADAIPRDQPPALQSLFRDRYRFLWELTVVGRLERSGRLPAGSLETLRNACDRVFASLEAHDRSELFQRVADDDQPEHERLTALAGLASHEGPRSQPPAHSRRGGVCPVCGFPTSDWVDSPESIPLPVRNAVLRSVPHWEPAWGICRRCHELYESRAGQPTAPPMPAATREESP